MNLNIPVDRNNTNALKWMPNALKETFGRDDVLPMWIADMDFKCPQPVIDALTQRAQHGIFGYSDSEDSYYEAIIDWNSRRKGWQLESEWLVFTPGVVPAITHLIQTICQPGDQVIIQNPVYYPFQETIEANECIAVFNPLLFDGERYSMGFVDLESKAADPKAKMMILCSPHNPVGRVWTREELIRVGEICLRNNVLVVVDEIHSDLILKGHTHIPLATLSEKFAKNSVTCTSPSKTFNLAGLKMSTIIVPDQTLRERYQKVLEKNAIWLPGSFGIVALETAYREGEPWLEEVLTYIEGNMERINAFLKERLPEIRMVDSQGTYLAWLDFRRMGMEPEVLDKWIIEEARLALDGGTMFGAGGEGFQRVNVACPRSVVEEALNRLEKAVITWRTIKGSARID